MTSRERIVETLNHREPEELAIDFGGMRSTGIHALAYNKLVRHLGFHLSPLKIYDVFQQLAEPQAAVVARLGGDVLQTHQRCPAFGITIDGTWRETSMIDGTTALVPDGYHPVSEQGGEYLYMDGVKIAYKPDGGYYFDQVYHPYQGCATEAEIDKIPLTPWTDADVDFMAAQAKAIYEGTDKAVLLAFGGNILEAGQLDFGYEDFYANLLLEPDLMHYYFSRITDNYLISLEKLMARVGEYAQVIQFGDDLGTQQAQQISTETYRKMIKPYHARQYRFIRDQYPATKVFLHSCGAIESLIPDLIDAGVEVLNPVQISAKGMDPIHLKREYGKSLSFWGGGANTSQTVTYGSVDQVRKETKELIQIFAPGGGFVFNQVHNIQPDVPAENILAIYDTALAYRGGNHR